MLNPLTTLKFEKLPTKWCLLPVLLTFFIFSHLQASAFIPDTIHSALADTALLSISDTLKKGDTIVGLDKKSNKFELTSVIDYSSGDSIVLDLKEKKAWMYNDANVKYEDIKINAGLIMIDFTDKTFHAFVNYDSIGVKKGVPDFTQGGLNFKSDEIAFCFTTKKGLIKNVITKEGEGYLHGSVVKKINDKVSNIGSGVYTTCDLPENPHFDLRYTRAKVITGDKIITGPAYIEVEGVPLPIALPFGLFPNKKGRSSGLIIPRYGESANRGFYLEEGGYYLGLNDYIDLKLTGDIYSRGSWAVKPKFTYRKRYKYSGSFNFNYAVVSLGVKGTSDYSKKKDFFINWSHSQDPKARPNSIFSASVQAGTSSYNQYNPGTVNDYLNNSFSSSISYGLNFGQFANLTTSIRHSQVTSTKMATLTLPEVSFGINRIYPFKRKIQTGKSKWYESLSITYNMDARNEVNAPDSILFTKDVLKYFQNGIKHSIPATMSFKVLKYFNWTNSVNYTERWYTRSISKKWNSDTLVVNGDTLKGYVTLDTINGFKAARDYSFSSSLGTTLYGMKQFKKGYIRAIRHVVYPSVGFSYTPDFGRESLGYYNRVQTDVYGKMETYSVFGGNGTFNPLYGYPGNQKSGFLNLNLRNNLEMKVRSRKDTITGMKKVILIENLSLGTGYNLAKDSLNWSPINISGSTTLFKKFRISFSGAYEMYAADSNGRLINKFQYEIDKRLLRFVRSSWNLNLNYDLKPSNKKSKQVSPGTNASSEEIRDVQLNPQHYIDWDNPWSLRFDYILGYTSAYNYQKNKIERNFTQTINGSGDISVTDKWKVSMQTGYDMKAKDFTFTQISVYRDLHCWEMRFSWVPYGTMKSWNFQINAKSSLLQDLKLTKKKDFRDNL